MALSGKVESAVSSVCGFDCDVVVSPELAKYCYAIGYRFCLRYLSLTSEATGDLSQQEASDILGAGLALMPVEHVRDPNWNPTEALGQEYGQNAVTNAQKVGFPAGVNLWCDLEGVAAGADAQQVVGYCEAWYHAVNSAGYVPGLYVGARALLTGEQLYNLPFQHYWRSSSDVPSLPNRGYQMLQLISISINNFSVDLNFMQNDSEGGSSQWLRVSNGS